ncbi:hypothetical protein AcV7_007589 [Taiwanofungus camphoratus]|nr:hypothetical protein AcV7_007589 [Antrodia cinnamomea]
MHHSSAKVPMVDEHDVNPQEKGNGCVKDPHMLDEQETSQFVMVKLMLTGQHGH